MPTGAEPLRHELLVVTGASTGIGVATAHEPAGRGFHVLAGMRRGADAHALRATSLKPSCSGNSLPTASASVRGKTARQRGRYTTPMHSVISQAQAAIPKGVPAEETGRVIADAIATSGRPR